MKNKKIKIIASLIFTFMFILIPIAFADVTTTSDTVTPITTPVDSITTPIVAPVENILIRNSDKVIYSGTTTLPPSGTTTISDDTGVTRSVNNDSVLGVLYALSQEANSTFTLSDLAYYSSYNEFYLKCVTASGYPQICDNWQYVVGGTTPSTSMDGTVLSGGENIGLYFGNPHQVILDKNTMYSGESFNATAEKYNYLDNTWGTLTGVTIALTEPNKDDPYNPTIIGSEKVDSSGSVTLTPTTAGEYNVGIVEDSYFPSYSLTVSTHPQEVSSGGSSGSILPIIKVFDIAKATSYLENAQSSDGSFDESDLYTDWAAIAYSAVNVSGSERSNILSYMSAHNTISNLLTDNERHAIALLTLGQNPYSFNGTNYINAIIGSFDGVQFGDTSLDNDDIFALIPLSSAGYTSSDAIISKDVSFVLKKQQPDGSWDGSIDITAAAIQALKPFSDIPGVSVALTNSSTYIANEQESDGGWSNISSSSWAAQAMYTLSASWTKNNKTVANYFASQQAPDGATSPISETLQNRIWSTSYVIPAFLGKTWSMLMQPVQKPVNNIVSNNIPSETKQTPEIKHSSSIAIAKLPVTPINVPTEKNTESANIASQKENMLASVPKNQSRISVPFAILLSVFVGSVVVYTRKHFR